MQIPWLGSKFCGPQKTVGPTNHYLLSKMLIIAMCTIT